SFVRHDAGEQSSSRGPMSGFRGARTLPIRAPRSRGVAPQHRSRSSCPIGNARSRTRNWPLRRAARGRVQARWRRGLLGALKKGASAARGWVIVGYELNDGSLSYGHAYVRDFGATPDGRKQYVEAFLRNVDWDHVNRQLAQAEAAKGGADATGL